MNATLEVTLNDGFNTVFVWSDKEDALDVLLDDVCT